MFLLGRLSRGRKTGPEAQEEAFRCVSSEFTRSRGTIVLNVAVGTARTPTQHAG